MTKPDDSETTTGFQLTAHLLGIELQPADRAALQAALSDYLGRAAAFRDIDPGDAEPPVMLFGREARGEHDDWR